MKGCQDQTPSRKRERRYEETIHSQKYKTALKYMKKSYSQRNTNENNTEMPFLSVRRAKIRKDNILSARLWGNTLVSCIWA